MDNTRQENLLKRFDLASLPKMHPPEYNWANWDGWIAPERNKKPPVPFFKMGYFSRQTLLNLAIHGNADAAIELIDYIVKNKASLTGESQTETLFGRQTWQTLSQKQINIEHIIINRILDTMIHFDRKIAVSDTKIYMNSGMLPESVKQQIKIGISQGNLMPTDVINTNVISIDKAYTGLKGIVSAGEKEGLFIIECMPVLFRSDEIVHEIHEIVSEMK